MENVLIESNGDGLNIYYFNNSKIQNVRFNCPTKNFHVNCDMRMWVDVKKRYENRLSKRVKRMINDFKYGFVDRFPLCCILHFCLDTFIGKYRCGERRGSTKNKYGIVYVPCLVCKRKIKK